MSYKPHKNEDNLSELISQMNDSKIISEKLAAYKDDFDHFILWFDKAMRISKRDTLIFIRKNHNEFSDEIKKYINQYVVNKPNKEDFLNDC